MPSKVHAGGGGGFGKAMMTAGIVGVRDSPRRPAHPKEPQGSCDPPAEPVSQRCLPSLFAEAISFRPARLLWRASWPAVMIG